MYNGRVLSFVSTDWFIQKENIELDWIDVLGNELLVFFWERENS
jgi:hypothetical protein